MLGTKKIPYTIEAIDIKLKEIAVASGAPIKPRLIGLGPHTVPRSVMNTLRQKKRLDTKKVVENHVDGRNDDDDLGWDRKEALRLEVSTARRSVHFQSSGIGHTEIYN